MYVPGNDPTNMAADGNNVEDNDGRNDGGVPQFQEQLGRLFNNHPLHRRAYHVEDANIVPTSTILSRTNVAPGVLGLEQTMYPSGHEISNNEVDAMMKQFTKQDDAARKTFTRKIVETYLAKRKWYNPQRDDPNSPSLSQGWAYFEHITLSRRLTSTEVGGRMIRAEPGETTSETELYSPYATPESYLSEWGIGFGLYFATVRIMGIIFLIAGIINIANIYYYRTSAYSNNRQHGLRVMVRGSAVCTDWHWVPCLKCTSVDWKYDPHRFVTATNAVNSVSGEPLTFAKKNICNAADLKRGMVNWFSLIWCSLCIVLLSAYQLAAERRLDENLSTSTDYTVLVSNPPPDALDPQEWRDFFSQFAEKQVTLCTIALDNRELISKLVQRRIWRRKLADMLPDGVDMKNPSQLRKAVESQQAERLEKESAKQGCLVKLGFRVVGMLRKLFHLGGDEMSLMDRIAEVEDKIRELRNHSYSATHVFVTFETEGGQRNALAALSVGKVRAWMNSINHVAPSAVFKGRVLKVKRPAEPSAIRWLDLNVSFKIKVFQRVTNATISVGIMTGAAFAIGATRRQFGAFTAAILISLINFIIPNVCKILNSFEAHSSEGGWQTSMYLKITIFRWVNTVLLASVITPFTSTTSADRNDLLPTVAAIFLAELLVSPTLNLADIWGNIRKHIIAPRSTTQERMNLCFTGTIVHLAERYTELTKITLLAFFYSALYPAGFIVGAITMAVQYFTDKYCLMRQWAPVPLIGTQLAKFSRRYFFSAALVIFASASAYAWAGFPYDNLCALDAVEHSNTFSGQVQDATGYLTAITVQSGQVYKFCNQNIVTLDGWNFPALPRFQPEGSEWMTVEQAKLVALYGWSSAIALIVWFLFLFGSGVYFTFISFFTSTYKPCGEDQNIDFSSVQEVFAYVPQVRIDGFSFPFLTCSIDNFDESLVGWRDPHNSLDRHNLLHDVPIEGEERRNASHARHNGESCCPPVVKQCDAISKPSPGFNIIKHWPPAWVKELQ